MTVERGTQPAAMSAGASSDHGDSPAAGASSVEPPLAPGCEEVPLVTINEDEDTSTEVTEPSASEEQLQEAEQK